MKYTVCLIQNFLLLTVLFRMTYLGLHAQRTRIFIFLSAWLLAAVVSLFFAQVWEISSKEYAALFFICSIFAWLCGLPEVIRAAGELSKNWLHFLAAIGVLLMAIFACLIALQNVGLHPLAKYLAVNYWIAIFFGTTFLLASPGATRPDAVLWRCAGAFFLIFGFGHLIIGALRLGMWSYAAASLAGSLAWFALAYFLDANHDALFNFEKLGITLAGLKFIAFPKVLEKRHG